MLFDDSHAFWAVVDDLVVTPLVDGHLAPFTRKSLDKIIAQKSKDKSRFDKSHTKCQGKAE